jgi:hypothetical protein
VIDPSSLPEPDPLMRLVAFRQKHPGVIIGRAESGAGWEAKVKLPGDVRGHFSPRPLSLLLDALEEELDSAPP